MDNMRVSFDRPQEDEAALCNRGVPSPFATVAFPNRPVQHPRYVDLEELSAGELARWERGMRTFLKEWVSQGPTHHFALGIGHRAKTVKKLADVLRIEAVIVAPPASGGAENAV